MSTWAEPAPGDEWVRRPSCTYITVSKVKDTSPLLNSPAPLVFWSIGVQALGSSLLVVGVREIPRHC